MSLAQSLQSLKDSLDASADRMPVLFVGHGSPMNAIEDTPYGRAWAELGKILPRPKAVLAISAHWATQGGLLVHVGDKPKTIHDFYGFPPDLYAQQYAAPGAPDIARQTAALLSAHRVQEDTEWGLDHGTWAVLKFIFPQADVPVYQLSIDMGQELPYHVALGKELAALRDRGVLIIGSGNIVHNLRFMSWDARPRDWAVEFDTLFADRLRERDFAALSDRKALGSLLRMAHPSIDHYLPALIAAGASDEKDTLTMMTEDIDLSSVAMRSFIYS